MMIPIIYEWHVFFKDRTLFWIGGTSEKKSIFSREKIRPTKLDFLSDAVSWILRIFSIGWMRSKGHGQGLPEIIQGHATDHRRALGGLQSPSYPK